MLAIELSMEDFGRNAIQAAKQVLIQRVREAERDRVFNEFRGRIAEGGFIEYAEVYGNLYGTPRQWVEERLSLGEDVVLKIDVQGGLNVKRVMPDAVMVFLVPPSIEELERRIRVRGSDSEECLARRLREAAAELDQIPHYDYVIENDTIAKAAEELRAVIIAEHCKVQ